MHAVARRGSPRSQLIAAALACVLAPAAAWAVAPYTIQVVDGDTSSYVGEFSSLRVDRQGHPHVAYYDGLNGDLKYAWHDGVQWQVSVADSSAHDVGQFASLALDTLDRPHIAYHDDTIGRLCYATLQGGTWIRELADSSSFDCGWYTSIAVDRHGRPWIASYDRGTGNPRLSVRGPGGGWTGEYSDTTFDLSGFYASLAVDATDTPHLAYYDLTHGQLMYATKRFGRWVQEVADSTSPDAGLYASLQLDRFGQVHVGYMDLANFDLRYARRGAGASGTWTRETVVGGPEVMGYDCSLALDPLGYPVLAYQDGDALVLRLMHRDASGWHAQLVDDGPGIVGLYTSVGTAADGRLFVSYWDGTAAALRVANAPPQFVAGAEPPTPVQRFRVSPNPARAGDRILLSAAPDVRTFELFDVTGRRVASLAADAHGRAEWSAEARRAADSHAGLYFARPLRRDGSHGETVRLTLVR